MTKILLQEKFNFDIWMNLYDSIRTNLEEPPPPPPKQKYQERIFAF